MRNDETFDNRDVYSLANEKREADEGKIESSDLTNSREPGDSNNPSDPNNPGDSDNSNNSDNLGDSESPDKRSSISQTNVEPLSQAETSSASSETVSENAESSNRSSEDSQNSPEAAQDLSDVVQNSPEAASDSSDVAQNPSETTQDSSDVAVDSSPNAPLEASDDIYAIKDSPESSPTNSPNVAGTDSTGGSDSPRSAQDRSTRKAKNADKRRNKFDSASTAASLDDIYERRRKLRERERANGNDPDRLEIPDRPPLPLNPFWTGMLRPLLSPKFLVRVLIIVAMGFIPFYCAMQYYIHLQFAEIDSAEKPLNVFLQAIWEDRVVLFLFSFLWGVLSIPNSFYVFEATVNGDDVLDEGPEFSFVGGFGQFAWFGIIIVLSGLPCYLIGSALGVGDFSFILGCVFLFPIFFLSCMETDTLFALLSKNVYRSLKVVRPYWIKFYIVSGVLVALSLLFSTSLLLSIAKHSKSVGFVLTATLLATFFFSVVPMIYLRVLGRLAWIIQEMEPEKDDSDDD